jgi:hypothetical protein
MENKELSIVHSQLSFNPIYQDLLGRIAEVYSVARKGATLSHFFGFAECGGAAARVESDLADGGKK